MASLPSMRFSLGWLMMMKPWWSFAGVALALTLVPLPVGAKDSSPAAAVEIAAPPLALAEYLARAEPEAKWQLVSKAAVGTTEVWTLKLVSQVWHGIPWEHDLLVFRPVGAAVGKVFLVNEGGKAGPQKLIYGAMLADKVKAPVALLLGIPNQPLFDGKKEDDLIAETFVRYLDSEDGSWPLLFPMVKSLVKAMDSIQEFAPQEWSGKVEKFIVGGASKRGWTTWLTAASDPRVMAITPMVIDVLNIRAQLPHQKETLGGPSEQISPYTKRGLVPLPDTPAGKLLWTMVDPWVYRTKFVMPKLIVLGNNDRYWSTDALNLYWDDLPGEKYISYTPNAGHDLTERDAAGQKQDPFRAVNNIAAFVRHQLTGAPMPKLDWTHGESEDGKLTLEVKADPAPSEARLWVATSKTRDFRDSRWESRPIELKDGQPVRASLDRPAEGYVAYYADLKYGIDDLPQWLCTQLRVVGEK